MGKETAVALGDSKVEEASGQSLGPTPQAPWKVMGQEPRDLLLTLQPQEVDGWIAAYPCPSQNPN
ncbi:hypothetical protein P7K49_029248 [Saguinus oedipus]|uniref:Uncharacterized protein n=1 Tax=Saguinus oedipus TaxID=9490 RepID=A0ABQ9U6N5_SAGOE|nr:hypothetical protein P7K49_029248 [Saguinus oedipus]